MPTKQQVGGLVRCVLAALAGWLKAKNVDIAPLMDPTIVDAIAGLIIVAVAGWSIQAKPSKKKTHAAD